MIKFFRHIRKSLLMEQNKAGLPRQRSRAGKYFKYAIGEIVLVMVGILLALQVSNWNQQRNQRKQEHKILLSLKTDFIESKKRLVATMHMQKNTVRKSIELIKIYEGKVPRPSNDSILNYLAYGATSWYRAELLTGAYDALINTGNSELIRNDQLTKVLAEYFSIVKIGFEDQENSMALLINIQNSLAPVGTNLGLPKLRKRIGLDTIRSPKEDMAIDFIFKQDAFFGNLIQKTELEYLRYTIQEDLLTKITQILTILTNEIEHHK